MKGTFFPLGFEQGGLSGGRYHQPHWVLDSPHGSRRYLNVATFDASVKRS
jgi:hypothetical protein